MAREWRANLHQRLASDGPSKAVIRGKPKSRKRVRDKTCGPTKASQDRTVDPVGRGGEDAASAITTTNRNDHEERKLTLWF
jgi:hypothetical protein